MHRLGKVVLNQQIMSIKSVLGSCLITLLMPLTSIASPSGMYRPAACEINQRGSETCQVKYNYLGRMEYMQMTVRWPDGTVTKFKKRTGDSNAPWTDSFDREWVETSNTVAGIDPRLTLLTNVRNGNVISLRMLD